MDSQTRRIAARGCDRPAQNGSYLTRDDFSVVFE
jgi:hypothetical protein